MTFFLMNKPFHFQSLLATGEDSDFKVLAKNERGELIAHKVHKIILKQSPYFKGLFGLSGSEASKQCVTFDNISSEILTLILKYLYCVELNMDVKCVIDLAIAADYLQMNELVERCLEAAPVTKIANRSEVALHMAKLLTCEHLVKQEDTWDALWMHFVAGHDSCTNWHELSDKFIVELLRRFGTTIPYQSYIWLSRWACTQEEDQDKIDSEERARRYKVAVELANEFIDFKVLSIERILKLSKVDLLPAESLMKKMQELLPAREIRMKEYLSIDLTFDRDEVKVFEFKDKLWTFECMVFAVQKDTDTAWKFNKLRDVNVKSTVKLRHPKSDVVFGNSIASSTKVSTLNEAKVDGKLTFVVELIEI